MGYRLNRLDEPIFMTGPKPMRTEFGIRQILESCEWGDPFYAIFINKFFEKSEKIPVFEQKWRKSL